MRGLALAVGLLVAVPASAATAPGASRQLDELLAQFKRAPGLFAHFREEKHLAMLDQPLVTEGTIHFSPPGRLARHAVSPLPSSLVIDGNQLRFSGGGQGVDLATNPVARLFVDSFVKLLAGDRAGLERLFTVEPTTKPQKGSSNGWSLRLVPRVAPMDKVIKELVLGGDGLVLRQLDLRETSGDWTHTTFTDVDVHRRYTPAELTRIFTLPDK